MNTSDLPSSESAQAVKQLAAWLVTFRITTLMVLLGVGGFYILLCLWGFAMNGIEPDPGMSFDEFVRLRNSGYYRHEALQMMTEMSGYLMVVALPYRWIIRSRTRFVVVFLALSAVFGFKLFSRLWDIVSRIGDVANMLNRLSWLQVDLAILAFYAMAPLSLYLFWRYGRRVA